MNSPSFSYIIKLLGNTILKTKLKVYKAVRPGGHMFYAGRIRKDEQENDT